MILLARLIATVIAVAVLGGFAVVFAALDGRFASVRARIGPKPWRQPWIDLVALSRKRRLRPAMASPWYPAWPVIGLASTGTAALIVPGFAFGTLAAPLATVPILVGLLGLATAARLAALLESGDGQRGLTASRAARRLLTGGAVWLTVFALPRHGNEPATALAGLAAVLTLPCFSLAEPADYAGPERALFRVEAILRRAVMLAAVIALIGGLPDAAASRVATWPLGLAGWSLAMLLLGSVTLWCAPRRFATGTGVACAGLAVLVLVVQTVPETTVLLACGAIAGLVGLTRLGRHRDMAEAAGLVQIGIALAGFGIGGSGALLILAVVTLARLAGAVARTGWVANLALLAMIGLPPFAGFAGDFAVVRAGFAADRWLGWLLLGVWVTLVMVVLRRLPANAATPARRMVPALAGLGVAMALGLMPRLLAGTP